MSGEDFFGHDSFRPEQETVLRSALNRQERLLEICLAQCLNLDFCHPALP